MSIEPSRQGSGFGREFVDAIWAWKSWARGHNPILYDLGIVDGADPTQSAPGAPLLQAARPATWALGDTLRYANLIDLLAMEPRGELASTGYALALNTSSSSPQPTPPISLCSVFVS